MKGLHISLVAQVNISKVRVASGEFAPWSLHADFLLSLVCFCGDQAIYMLPNGESRNITVHLELRGLVFVCWLFNIWLLVCVFLLPFAVCPKQLLLQLLSVLPLERRLKLVLMLLLPSNAA